MADAVPRIDSTYLRQFPETCEFENRENVDFVVSSHPDLEPEKRTPDELISIGFEHYHAALEDEMLSRIQSVSPAFFERLVIELPVAMGYGGSFEDAASVVGRTGDGGTDGVIKEDRHGLNVIYVQARRWQGTVGRPVVAEFVGNLAPIQAARAI